MGGATGASASRVPAPAPSAPTACDLPGPAVPVILAHAHPPRGVECRLGSSIINVALPSLGSPIREGSGQAVGDERYIFKLFGFAALSERSFASTTLEAQTQVGYGT